jgi:Flp pilus assembly protein TadG
LSEYLEGTRRRQAVFEKIRLRRLRGERGAVAVEFAIILPLLIVMLFAIIAFGIALFRLITYVGAAREGARYAAVHCAPQATACTPAMISDRVVQAASGNYVGPGIPAADKDCTTATGEPVTVSWQQSIPIEIPLLPDLSVTRSITGTFRCE